MIAALIHVLDDLPKWFQMLFVSGTTVIFTVLGVFLIRRGVKFKTKAGEVEIGAEGKSENKTGSGAGGHADVAVGYLKAGDVAMMFNTMMRVLTRKLEIKNYLMIRKIMNFTEERIDHGLMMFQNIYLQLLKRKGMQNVTCCDSFNVYLLVLAAMKTRLLHEFRTDFHNEQFSELDDAEFEVYTDHKLDTIQNLTTATLNELYFFNQDVTRDELYDANMMEASRMKSVVKEIYQHGRKVALDYGEEMRELDESAEKMLMSIIGKQ